MDIKVLLALFTFIADAARGFKTGLENGLICYQCVGTHPGCSLYDMDWRWYWGKICPRSDDRCVKLIERKGAEVMVTRDCLSNLEAHRTDIPADKYEGCYPGTHDVKLGQYVFNRIKELDVKRNYYDNTTWCMCQFDHWCNSAPNSMTFSLFTLASLSSIPIIFTLFRK